MSIYHFLNRQMISVGDWATHQEGVQYLVDKAIKAMPFNRSAMILGAGNCRDIPLDIVTAHFDSVILVDVDDETLQHVASKFSNISRISYDLSGLHAWINTLPTLSSSTSEDIAAAETAWEQYAIPPLPTSHPLTPWMGRCDLVISIGVATQLIRPVLSSKFGSPQSSEIAPWPDIQFGLVRKHYQLIEQLLHPQGIGILGTEIMTSEWIPNHQLEAYADMVYNAPIDIVKAMKTFPKSFIKIGAALYLEYLKQQPGGIVVQWPWRFDWDRLYLMAGCLVNPAQKTGETLP